MPILLNDEEIKAKCHIDPDYEPSASDYVEFGREVAKAQLKAVAEWGDSKCPHYTNITIHRSQCEECWQDLNKEIK